VVNDAKVMEFMKAKYVKMEQDLKNAQDELNGLRMRPALATQREDYVLGEITTGKPIYAVCLRLTAKHRKRTANLSPCVSSRRTPHGDAGHGERSMPCANRKTHSKVFAVCSQPTHGEVK
jgi:hypothetical protein